MSWVLVIFIIINLISVLIILLLSYFLIEAREQVYMYHSEWTKWEHRWYKAQALISEELNYHISPDGLKTEMKLTKHKNEMEN